MTVAAIVASAEPSNVALPVASPLSAIVLGVLSLVDVSELPKISPGNLPSAFLTATLLASVP